MSLLLAAPFPAPSHQPCVDLPQLLVGDFAQPVGPVGRRVHMVFADEAAPHHALSAGWGEGLILTARSAVWAGRQGHVRYPRHHSIVGAA